MRQLSAQDITAMEGNGASMRLMLTYFLGKGADIYMVYERTDPVERYFLVKYQGLNIPLRTAKKNFYCVYNSSLSQTIADDKYKADSILKAFDMPVPQTVRSLGTSEDETFLAAHTPIVVKPVDGAHGDGITTSIETADQLQKAIHTARTVSPDVLLQQQVSGYDHRLFFVDGALTAAVKRIPASVKGDGTATIKQLVENRNEAMAKLVADLRAGKVHDSEIHGSTSRTPLEEVITAFGEDFLNTVPKEGEIVPVVKKANVSIGGQTEDITDTVNQELADMIARMLKNIDMPICGVDVISTDISASPSNKLSYIIELNVAPGLRLHESPTVGQPRMVCAQIAESLINHYKGIA